MSVAATPVALTGADQSVSAGPATYRGYSLAATAAAVVKVWDNPSAASGTLLDTITLGANASLQAWYGSGGLRAARGVFVQVVSGTVEGSVRIG
ncbi:MULTISPECIES: hypothetical protein [Micromonospora]|uniref:hypothetical protein n=1 Tax=Micromonospora TaxID=1873 RepID=UPI0021A359A4|nr:hypothetical protein [Micromonospora chalcea]MCT2276319.1 hypothetical protein [Micromonospora chalcea]